MAAEADSSQKGLWLYDSWRELVISCSVTLTIAYYLYCNEQLGLGDSSACYKLIQSSATLNVSFFVTYTTTKYPQIKEVFTLEDEVTKLDTAISNRIIELQNRNLDTINSNSDLAKLIELINQIRLNLSFYNEDDESELTQIKDILTELNDRITIFEAQETLDQAVIKTELNYWQSKELKQDARYSPINATRVA